MLHHANPLPSGTARGAAMPRPGPLSANAGNQPRRYTRKTPWRGLSTSTSRHSDGSCLGRAAGRCKIPQALSRRKPSATPKARPDQECTEMIKQKQATWQANKTTSSGADADGRDDPPALGASDPSKANMNTRNGPPPRRESATHLDHLRLRAQVGVGQFAKSAARGRSMSQLAAVARRAMPREARRTLQVPRTKKHKAR